MNEPTLDFLMDSYILFYKFYFISFMLANKISNYYFFVNISMHI